MRGPDVPDHRCTQGRHDRAARGADPAPRRLHEHAQGAEVLAVRRRAPAGLARARATRTRSRSGSGGGRTTSGSSTGAGGRRVRGESTPFYLWSRGAHRRIAEQLPDVRLIAVVRDPIDRAYSNWMHLWSDGLEPVGDFEEAFALQDERIAPGLGAVLALPRPRPVRRAARAPVQLRRPASGCSCCATATIVDDPRGGGRPGLPLPRDPPGPGRRRSRTTTRAASSSPAGGRR